MAHRLLMQQNQNNIKQIEASTQQKQAKTKETEVETRRLLVEHGIDVEQVDAPTHHNRQFQEKRESIPRPTMEVNSTES